MKSTLEFASMYGPAQPISKRDAWDIESMLEAKSHLSGPAYGIVSDWLTRRAMKLKGWRSPYSCFKRTSEQKNWTIASYHHPARLCWSWSLSLRIGQRVGGLWRKPWHSGYGQWVICLPRLIEFRFHRQPYDYMISGNAEQLLRLLAAHARQEQQREAA